MTLNDGVIQERLNIFKREEGEKGIEKEKLKIKEKRF